MTRFEKILTWSSIAVVSLTGFVYAWMKFLMEPTDPWAVVNHPLQPFVLKLHIVTAPFLVFAIGILFARHILPQLRARARTARLSGTSAAWLIVPMVLSGYLIQAITHATLLQAMVLVHLATGSIFALAAGGHWLSARLRDRRTRTDRGRGAAASPPE